MRGLSVGGKATVLDAMTILNDLWNQDGKYARPEGMRRCWRKAAILPEYMDNAINQELGSNSIPQKAKVLSKEDSDELCDLMTKLQVKVKETGVDTNTDAYALQGSFAADVDAYSGIDFAAMAESWIDIEDEPEIMDAILDEEIENIESAQNKDQNELAVEDDDEPEAEEMEIDDADILTFAEAEEALRRLSLSAESLGVPLAQSVHLDRFARAMRTARASKPKRDRTLHAFFKKST